MSKRHLQLLLEDIYESAERILTYTQLLTYEAFTAIVKLLMLWCAYFELIGEAANRLPDEFKCANKQLDWHKIRGLEIESFIFTLDRL